MLSKKATVTFLETIETSEEDELLIPFRGWVGARRADIYLDPC